MRNDMSAISKQLVVKEATDLIFEPWPDIHRFEAWKSHFYREAAAKSNRPRETVVWLREIELAKDCVEPMTPISKEGHDFESLDFKMASGLWRILKRRYGENIELRRKKIEAGGPASDVVRKTDCV